MQPANVIVKVLVTALPIGTWKNVLQILHRILFLGAMSYRQRSEPQRPAQCPGVPETSSSVPRTVACSVVCPRGMRGLALAPFSLPLSHLLSSSLSLSSFLSLVLISQPSSSLPEILSRDFQMSGDLFVFIATTSDSYIVGSGRVYSCHMVMMLS